MEKWISASYCVQAQFVLFVSEGSDQKNRSQSLISFLLTFSQQYSVTSICRRFNGKKEKFCFFTFLKTLLQFGLEKKKILSFVHVPSAVGPVCVGYYYVVSDYYKKPYCRATDFLGPWILVQDAVLQHTQ